MTEPPGVGPEIFGADYLHFYAPMLSDERNEREVELIARLLAAGFEDALALDEHGAPLASGARRLVVLATR